MTKTELLEYIEVELAMFPVRMGGNDVNARMAEYLRPLASSTERALLIEVLRDYLAIRIPDNERQPEDAIRESRLWLALRVAEKLCIKELLPDIESLLLDVKQGRTLLPVYEKGIERILSELQS